MHSRSESYDGCVAALPIAAALTLLLARWLPIRFEYRPNDLGIVSLTTQARYPIQQEMFSPSHSGWGRSSPGSSREPCAARARRLEPSSR
jgi:hypothetical protein